MCIRDSPWTEWDASQGLDWSLLQWDVHRTLRDYMRELNTVYQKTRALHAIDFTHDGFEWIEIHDSDNSILSFLRKGPEPGEVVVCVFNMTPVVREGYRVGVPHAGEYREILNSDAAVFGGSDVHGPGPVPSEPIPWADKPHSFSLTLPPLAGVYLAYRAPETGE